MPPYAFFKGDFIPLSEAKVSAMTHALHYGTACFEGIRGNWNEERKEIYLFRLEDHYDRLAKSCHVLKIQLPFSVKDLCEITVELVRRSEFKEDVYIRPLAYKSSQVLGPRLHNLEDDFFILVFPPGPYVDYEKGIRCGTSSWRRVDETMIPPRAKISGLYVNSCFAKTEANENGFDEAIMLNSQGHVSEGTGENLFIVVKGMLITPPSFDSILPGITRDTVIRIAKEELGIETIERTITRSELYTADECFLTGTLAHITPVIEIDHRRVGDGKIGEITQRLQEIYFKVITGRYEKYIDWCTPVYSWVKA